MPGIRPRHGLGGDRRSSKGDGRGSRNEVLGRDGAIPALILAGLALAAPGLAQQTPNAAPGLRAEGVYDFGSGQQVNAQNGSLSLQIPLGPAFPVGGGFGYQLRLRYSSSLWEARVLSSPCPTPSECPVAFRPKSTDNSGLGFRVSLGALMPPDDTWNATFHWLYVDAAGGEHFLYASPAGSASLSEDLEDLTALGEPVAVEDQLTVYSRDSTYIRGRRSSVGGPWTIEHPDGRNEIYTNFGSAGSPDYRLTSLRDAHGNSVSVGYSADGLTWTITDAHRTQEVVFIDPGAGFPDQRRLVERVRVRRFGGAWAEYLFEYGTITVVRPPEHTSSSRSLAVKVLTRITLPGSGLSYEIGTSGYLASEGGVLQRLGLPTLGAWEWSWTGIQFPLFQTVPRNQDEPVEPFRRVVGVSARRLVDQGGVVVGEWTYSRELDGTDIPPGPYPEKMTVTVETPLGDREKHYFSVWSVKEGLGVSRWGTSWGEYGLPYTRQTPDPLGGGRFLSSEVFDCAAGGVSCTKVRTTYVAYDQRATGTFNDETGILFNTDRRLESQRTVYHEDGDRWASTTGSDFDGLGHYRMRTTGGSFGSGDVRQTFTNWNPGRGSFPDHTVPDSSEPWQLVTFDVREVTEGGGSARVEACFDGATGFLRRQRVLAAGSAQGAHDLVQVLIDADGDGFAESERLYGGDRQSLPTGDLCDLALPAPAYELAHTESCGLLATSEFVGSGFKVVDRTIDCPSGLVSSQREVDGSGASYGYDTLARLTTVTPTSPGLDDAVTTITYTPASAPATKARLLVQSGGAEEDYHYDGLGRLVRQGRRMVLDDGSGTPLFEYRNRFTTYNALGLRATVSEWGDAAAVTTFSDFDPFGRPAAVTSPDGSRVTFAYDGARRVSRTVSIATSQSGEEPFTTTETYDRQGRLIEVLEPSGVDAQNPTTTATYGYDVGGRLTGVAVTGVVPGLGTVTQARGFTYDQRGFLLSEDHPEKSPLFGAGNGTVVYSQYDALGNVGRTVDGKSTLTFEYDMAGRLKEVWGPDPGLSGYTAKPLKGFTYGTGTSSVDLSRGKLKSGSRVELYTFDDGFVFEVELREIYTYGGRQGRVSGKRTELYIELAAAPAGVEGGPLPLAPSPAGAPSDAFTQSWSYTSLGDVATIGYPRCATGPCTGQAGLPSAPTISHTYSRGYLTRVPGYSTGTITYHPSGLVHRLPHANGVTDLQLADGSLGRPASLSTVGASEDWSSGSYRYDGAGNVEAIGDSWFSYDGVSRLREAQIVAQLPILIFADGFESGDTAAWDPTSALSLASLTRSAAQSFTYDPFGNLTAIAGDDGLTIPTDSRKNRLSAATYDLRGNLTGWNGQSYAYDAFNNLKRFQAGAEDAFYVYSVDDERILTFHNTPEAVSRWTLRDLDARVLRVYSTLRDGSPSPPWEVERDYVYRNGQPLAARVYEGNSLQEVRHFHLDHLGSPRLLTGDGGVTRARHTYLPYGRELTPDGQDTERLKFTSHERDLNATTGSQPASDDLDYMHARHYNPRLGRFLQLDPVGPDLRRPQRWNRYAYAASSPLTFTDPTGLIAIALSDLAREEIVKIAGEDADSVSFLDDGTLVVDATAEQLERNVGLRFLHQLARSEKTFALFVGTEIDTSMRVVRLAPGGEIENLSTTVDLRKVSRGLEQNKPTDGFDGLVAMGTDAADVRREHPAVGNRPVSFTLIFFHEVVENFYKTHVGLQYAPSHQLAIGAERRLRVERPELDSFALGGGPFQREVKR